MIWQRIFPEPPTRAAAHPGERLVCRNEIPTHAVYLKHGRAASGQVDEDGQLRHRLVTVDGPCWLDIDAVLLKTHCVSDWVAETPAEVQLVPADAMRRWFADQSAGTRALVRDTLELQRRQAESMLGLLAQDAESRCAQWLLRHAEVSAQGSVAVPMKEPKRAIAAQLGIAPETLSRVLRHLRESGLISQSGSVMNLIDPGGLRALAMR